MPTYQYACTECGERVEAVQKFTDEPLSVCLVCGGKLRKVFSPVGIVFKGSGFYRTDSRGGTKDKALHGTDASSTSSTEAKSSNDSGSESGSSSGSGDKKSEKAGTSSSSDSSSSSSNGSSGSSGSAASSSSSSGSKSGSKVA
ncbi:MAG: FmdB family zinc ribbon protein [Actinomycetota bacterium]